MSNPWLQAVGNKVLGGTPGVREKCGADGGVHTPASAQV